jgi:hypothetical protein
VGGDELQQVEGDVFRTAGGGVVAGIHRSLSVQLL